MILRSLALLLILWDSGYFVLEIRLETCFHIFPREAHNFQAARKKEKLRHLGGFLFCFILVFQFFLDDFIMENGPQQCWGV